MRSTTRHSSSALVRSTWIAIVGVALGCEREYDPLSDPRGPGRDTDRDPAQSSEPDDAGPDAAPPDAAPPDAAPPDAAPLDAGVNVTPRVVAIGDLHSDINATRAAFQLAGAVDANDEWVGGDLVVVQLGDIIGRGDDERQVLEFMFDVRRKAADGGGAVHVLVGNHEIMAGRVDNQAVGTNPFPGFEDLPDLDLSDPRLLILPVDERARGAALMAGGPYAKRLAEFPTVLQIDGTVFVHGGVVPRWATYGIDAINRDVSDWLKGNTPEPDCSLGVDSGDRVMWTRQFSVGVDADDCALLEQSLSILGAERMVVAHSVQTTITPQCDERVWAVDVGMSRFYSGPIEVLEIVDARQLTPLRQ